MTTNPTTPTAADESGPKPDYTNLNNSELIARVTSLEKQLRDQTARLAELTKPKSRPRSRSQSPRRARAFDPSLYATRHIALKFAYLGGRYGGFEHANGNLTSQPTIEEVLWKALRKTRLISPPMADGADEGMDVIWTKEKRATLYTQGDTQEPGKVRLDLSWEGCQYSKCGRTDRGVSAFGQVIGIRVRSNRPIDKETKPTADDHPVASDEPYSSDTDDAMPAIEADDLSSEPSPKPFDPINDELPYVTLLNSILPPDIRILAWCPDPPPTFDARFSCRERRYKYFFTNPAFCPTPGALGMTRAADGKPSTQREGWLDVDKMREAAKKLEGLHDFRNLCKIDASKQMSSCERRVTFADVVEFGETGKAFSTIPGLNRANFAPAASMFGSGISTAAGPKVYTFCVHGSAFLWHQVRCMVAVLFLVGQGLEDPGIVDELLDVEKNPGRPLYEMADDAPLVLWDCIFPDDDTDMSDSLQWIYAGDRATIPTLTTGSAKTDGKFGVGAVVDELWTQWREAKMNEILTASLLDLAIGQGDGSSFHRDAQRPTRYGAGRSQKVFDGSGRAKISGRYTPMMEKPKMETLQVLNAKWANNRKAKRERMTPEETNGE